MKLTQSLDVSLESARELLDAVVAECLTRDLRLACAVVDRGGNVVAALRMDGAQLAALSLATDKAFTAVSFGFPTSEWINSSAPGGSDWGLSSSLGGRAVVFPGGVPLRVDGHLVGALGVSGTASTVDQECAIHALQRVGFEVAS